MLQLPNQVKVNTAQYTITKYFCPGLLHKKSSKHSLKFVCLSLAPLMHRLLSVDNLPWNTATL